MPYSKLKNLYVEKIIEDIIFTGKVLYQEGLVNSHAGNISVRFENSIYILSNRNTFVFVPIAGMCKTVCQCFMYVHNCVYHTCAWLYVRYTMCMCLCSFPLFTHPP